MINEFKENAQALEREGAFSSATKITIAESQLIDLPDGRAELVTDRIGFALLVGQFEAMEAKGFQPVMRNETFGPNQKSLVFDAKDAHVVHRIYDQCKEAHKQYKDAHEQRRARQPVAPVGRKL